MGKTLFECAAALVLAPFMIAANLIWYSVVGLLLWCLLRTFL